MLICYQIDDQDGAQDEGFSPQGVLFLLKIQLDFLKLGLKFYFSGQSLEFSCLPGLQFFERFRERAH